ncbi:putative neural-cadherin 2 [Penaeus japonicus]|uniref:putative neural-cadherin 2 n=1 Tax=Penaeus japonicus TaxID=27405 RepID=UPI001C71666C|nr:putative neural-cadherin 2 [Penaeus japonicus]
MEIKGYRLNQMEAPNGRGVLGRLVRGVAGAAGRRNHPRRRGRSVYGAPPPAPGVALLLARPSALLRGVSEVTVRRASLRPASPVRLLAPPPAPSTCVWLSVRTEGGAFMDPVRLQGLLELHSRKISEATQLAVAMNECRRNGLLAGPALTHLHRDQSRDPSSAASLPSTSLPLQCDCPSLGGSTSLHFTRASVGASLPTISLFFPPVDVVDINATSLVTPRLTNVQNCHTQEPETCSHSSCLNGGKCARLHAENRCVCPGGSWGPRCKVVARTFSGAGWAWVRAPPSCLPARISLRLLIRRPSGLVFYSGPMAPTPRGPDAPPTPLLALQLWQGRPQLLLEGRGGPLKVELNTTLHNGHWHTIHIQFHSKGVVLMLDLCGRGWQDNNNSNNNNNTHCIARASWKKTEASEDSVWPWYGHGVLQLGGMAHTPARPVDHGWTTAPTSQPLEGCISDLRFNGQLVDLGEPAASKGSVGGCGPQEEACLGAIPGCGRRGRCVGGLEQPECECDPGWSGLGCAVPTEPVALGRGSYVKVALSFTPAPHVLTLQLRVRTRGARDGLLVHVNTHQEDVGLAMHLRAGVLCASLRGGGRQERTACVEGRPLSDGSWHTVRAERHGHNLVVSVDDGDGWRRNESLPVLEGVGRGGGRGPPPPLHVDKNEGITVGGKPEFAGVSLVTVRDDLKEVCIDDLRLSGRPLPLPASSNSTSWGQVSAYKNTEPGCSSPDACINTTCAVPLTCTSTWGKATCSCGPGRELVGRTCKDVDECLWQPCLHGGTCYNMRPGFLCVCGPGHSGHYCQWASLDSPPYHLKGTVAIVALALSMIFVVIAVIVTIRFRRYWLARPRKTRAGDVGGEGAQETTFIQLKGGTEEGGGGIALIPPNPILPRDDLRAYAYEGDGLSSGSLSSATSSGQQGEQGDETSLRLLVPAFLDVMDLLKNLPDATKSPELHISRNNSTIVKKQQKAPSPSMATSFDPAPLPDSCFPGCTSGQNQCPSCLSLRQSPARGKASRCDQEMTTSC